jgi:hypothetical protein
LKEAVYRFDNILVSVVKCSNILSSSTRFSNDAFCGFQQPSTRFASTILGCFPKVQGPGLPI